MYFANRSIYSMDYEATFIEIDNSSPPELMYTNLKINTG